MPPAVEATQAGQNGGDAKVLDISITVPAGLSNSVAVISGLVVGTSGDPGAMVTGSFDGTLLTVKDYTAFGGSNAWRTFMGYSLLPAAGGGKVAHLQWTNNGRASAAVYILSDVLQSGPVGTLRVGTVGNLSGTSCGLTDLLIDMCGSDANNPSVATPGAGQTQIFNATLPSGWGDGASSWKNAVVTSEAMSWAVSGNVRHIILPFVWGAGVPKRMRYVRRSRDMISQLVSQLDSG